MAMSVEEKVGHLLRRFGLGAGRSELDKYVPLGVDGTIDRLIDYEKVPDKYPVQIWEWYFQPDGKYSLDPTRVRAWWHLRMLTTERPLEEKLTLFWHNHFAISGAKVDFGPSMYQYIDVLRQNASGGFYPLLEATSKSPAMLRWLDTDQSLPGHPNENFGRELMELFTLGIGNYTEKDVQEVARAFIGWGVRYPIYERGGGDQMQKVKDAIEYKRPLVAFTYTPDMRDLDPKTILGKTDTFDADEVLKTMAYHPVTAKRLMGKMWSFFAYDNPEPAVIDRLVKVWYKSDLNTKAVLKAIAHSKEFWSEKAMGTKIKSPVDFTVAMLRQVDAGPAFLARRPADALPTDSMQKVVGDEIGALARALKNQGLDLLYPEDVSGWKWGPAWISAATVLERIRVNDLLFNSRGKNGAPGKALLDRLVAGNMKTSKESVQMILDTLDAHVPPEKQAVFVSVIDAAGGPAKAFANPRIATVSVKKVCLALFATPEFQLC